MHLFTDSMRTRGSAVVSAQQVTYETLDEGRSSNTHRWFGAYGPSKAALDHL
jgi:hypothetical protein